MRWIAVLLSLTAVHIAAGWQLSELPRHPAKDCNTHDVQKALINCGLTGPGPACCSSLDAVFADKHIPSAGCLCYPQVLYEIMQRGSSMNVDPLHLFQQCRKKQNSMLAWAGDNATADSPSSCPLIHLNDTAGTLLLRMGDAQVMSPDAPRWAWSNMLQTAELMTDREFVQNVLAQQVAGFFTFKLMFSVMACIAMLFLFLHFVVLRPWSTVYRRLSPMQQLVTCQHAVYALMLTLQLGPYTYLVVRLFFRSWTGDYIAGPELPLVVGAFLFSHAAMYVVEASIRSVKFSWVLVLHHQLFFVSIVAAAWDSNPAAFMIGILLDYFVCHEAGLYVVLLAYRLGAPRKFTLAVLYSSCVWYVVSRWAQTAMLLYMIVSWAQLPAVRTTPAFIIVTVLAGALTLIQAYTLVIYKGIGYRMLRKPAVDGQQKDMEVSDAATSPYSDCADRQDISVVVASTEDAYH